VIDGINIIKYLFMLWSRHSHSCELCTVSSQSCSCRLQWVDRRLLTFPIFPGNNRSNSVYCDAV